MGPFIRLLSFGFPFLTAHSWPAPTVSSNGAPVSAKVFESLEELARLVDISYCVGNSGIQEPFQCLSRCKEFPGFELVTTWNTGPLLSDSCGYIAISHEPYEKRVIVAFRGTYSIANTIADLSTRRAEYVPFPASNHSNSLCAVEADKVFPPPAKQHDNPATDEAECVNCTIHTGFWKSWQNTRCTILPPVEKALARYPEYQLVLVGHSLGGAVAAIAALEFQARGYYPHVTTFGEPRLGNQELNQYIDHKFQLNATSADDATFRRVTHVGDPVPLLPLEEWGYKMHAGEIFISKPSLPPSRTDVHACHRDADPSCIAGARAATEDVSIQLAELDAKELAQTQLRWGVPNRYKLWELFLRIESTFGAWACVFLVVIHGIGTESDMVQGAGEL